MIPIFYMKEQGQRGCRPFPLHPKSPPTRPPLRCGRSRLTIPNTYSTITMPASLRSDCCSPSLRNAVRLPSEIDVRLHRNTQRSSVRRRAPETDKRFARSLKDLVNALAEFEALGIAFVSFRDNLDLTTPAGRLMFQIIGAMAEFESALIQERVRAGLRNAKAKGVRLGRPRILVSEARIDALRGSGASWRTIAKELGISLGTLHRTAQGGTKKRCGDFGTGFGESDHAL